MRWFLEHSVKHLRSRGSRLSSKISLGSVIVVSIRPEIEIHHLLRDNLTLPLALLLVFLNLLIFINTIYKLKNTPHWLPN